MNGLPTPISIPLAGGQALMATGFEPLILRRHYDPRQAWLPFVTALIMTAPPAPPPKELPPKKKEMWRTSFAESRSSAAVPEQCRMLYHYETGSPQRGLPFPERRKIGVNEWKRIQGLRFPSFDRSDTGEVIRVHFSQSRRADMAAWCEQNCRGRYHIKPDFAAFEIAEDAALAALVV